MAHGEGGVAEDALVEIGREMLAPDGAVVGAEQPALGKAEDEVHGRETKRRSSQEALRLMGWWV